MAHICPWQHVWTFDNVFRPFIHNPAKMFSPYVPPGARVLDLGCGAGFASLGLARLVGDAGSVVAVDLQPEMLDMLCRRAVKRGLQERIVPTLCQPGALSLTGSFQFANAFYMVHEVPETRAFFKEVYDHLIPGGRFFVAEPVFHVTKKRFNAMRVTASEVGFAMVDRPRVRFSHAVVLGRPGTSPSLH